ncbi:MAG: rhodanese-like domain-containing protein [Cellvibrionales bacterium]|jgi:rhodanese-related sulfurtransferase|nr:rhodanese-like domain-containing protein [Cellvibrionales bacterium]
MKVIDAKTFQQDQRYRHRIIDVRSPAEFRANHVPGSENLPLDKVQAGILPTLNDGEVITLLCQSGKRSSAACELLTAKLGGNVVTIEGGIVALAQEGVVLEGSGRAWSLERQVRLVAGTLVFLGSLLSLLQPYFLAVPLFVGAGLMFAGITDTCGMAMLLARMPWNR